MNGNGFTCADTVIYYRTNFINIVEMKSICKDFYHQQKHDRNNDTTLHFTSLPELQLKKISYFEVFSSSVPLSGCLVPVYISSSICKVRKFVRNISKVIDVRQI